MCDFEAREDCSPEIRSETRSRRNVARGEDAHVGAARLGHLDLCRCVPDTYPVTALHGVNRDRVPIKRRDPHTRTRKIVCLKRRWILRARSLCGARPRPRSWGPRRRAAASRLRRARRPLPRPWDRRGPTYARQERYLRFVFDTRILAVSSTRFGRSVVQTHSHGQWRSITPSIVLTRHRLNHSQKPTEF